MPRVAEPAAGREWIGPAALLLALVAVVLSVFAAAAGACLIRPNLFAMVRMLAIAASWWEPAVRKGLRRSLVVAVPAGVAALGSASWQRALYGASTTTGYREVGTLFAWRHVWLNFPSWLYEAHGVFLLPAVVAPLVVSRGLCRLGSRGLTLWPSPRGACF
jgi:hypothetical protein